MMRWRLCCLLLAAIAVWKTHAKPLIEDATFTEIDLVAEDSQQNAVYVAAPIRTKRAPQFYGNNCPYSSNSASASSSSFSGSAASASSSSNIFGLNNYPDYNNYPYPYGPNTSIGGAGVGLKEPSAIVVNHEHMSHNVPPSPPFHGSQHYMYPPPPGFGYHNHHHKAHNARPPPPPPPPWNYYDNSLGFHNYRPSNGFHGHRPFGFPPGPPFGGPPDFRPPPFQGHPGFNRGPPPPPAHHPHPPHAPPVSAPIPAPADPGVALSPDTNTPQPVQLSPSSSAGVPNVNLTTIAPPTTTEAVFDIDIRIGD